jgi:hypothetical protein
MSCRPGAARSFDDLFGIDLAEAGDVFGDAAVQQFDVLRQVAQVRAQCLALPVADGVAIEQHLALHIGPDAHQAARQRRLAGTRWADDADHFAGLELGAYAAQDGLLAPGAVATRPCSVIWPAISSGTRPAGRSGFSCSSVSSRP